MGMQEYYEDSFKLDGRRSQDELLSEVLKSTKGLSLLSQELKDRFLANLDWSRLEILEAGSGRGGVALHLARLGAKVTLLDFSPTALEQGQALFRKEGLDVTCVLGDVTHPDLKLPKTFDLIVDSHLLHCITSDPDRASYYQLIKDSLSPGGIFVAETMVHRKKLFIPDGFMFDQTNTLWQLFGEWKPVRRILDSLDLEAEINHQGFEIIYFYYYAQYGFVPHKSFQEIPSEILPASVRLAFRKRAVSSEIK